MLLCAVFYAIGYGKAYQKSVDYANDFIDKNCIKKITVGDYISSINDLRLDFDFNITEGVENG